MVNDVRWKQRFQNFDRAYVLLRSAFDDRTLNEYSDLEKEGLIQRFEYTYELAWKTLKDYLTHSGINVSPVTPRNVIKQAFAAEIIEDGQVWIDMLLHRNLLAHSYDQAKFQEVLIAVEQFYLHAFSDLHDWLLIRVMNA